MITLWNIFVFIFKIMIVEDVTVYNHICVWCVIYTIVVETEDPTGYRTTINWPRSTDMLITSNLHSRQGAMRRKVVFNKYITKLVLCYNQGSKMNIAIGIFYACTSI